MTDTLSRKQEILTTSNGSALNVLRIRNFRLLWIGEGISLLGDQLYMIALPWLVLSLTGNALAVGTVMAMAGPIHARWWCADRSVDAAQVDDQL